MIRASRPAPALPPGGRQSKAIGTAKANPKITSSAGSPRKSSMYAVAAHRYGATGESFIRARIKPRSRPPANAITV